MNTHYPTQISDILTAPNKTPVEKFMELHAVKTALHKQQYTHFESSMPTYNGFLIIGAGGLFLSMLCMGAGLFMPILGGAGILLSGLLFAGSVAAVIAGAAYAGIKSDKAHDKFLDCRTQSLRLLSNIHELEKQTSAEELIASPYAKDAVKLSDIFADKMKKYHAVETEKMSQQFDIFPGC